MKPIVWDKEEDCEAGSYDGTKPRMVKGGCVFVDYGFREVGGEVEDYEFEVCTTDYPERYALMDRRKMRTYRRRQGNRLRGIKAAEDDVARKIEKSR